MQGEAVFYGPKIDVNVIDASGREWQCTTIQFDFNLPKRFRINYIGQDGRKCEAIMIHRALLGAIERFFAILIEHHKGNLPAWLAPIQVRILPISDYYMEYAERVHRKLLSRGVRAEIDNSSSTMSYKIRQAELQKIPYMIICGKHEAETKKIAVRKHGHGNIGLLKIEELIKDIQKDEMRPITQISISKRF
ncbi:MAG: threonine--tRNA ligase [Candidatus Bathyarchaeota archaeon]|nr:hypothetical protein [Candidatus Bathyarchaeota archaeon A05DMB-5]MDH7557049.1 threonine--tRNA ligase [Candidatus Bathyarchaeota archaeon]